ncbi:putative protein serine/threonine kinase [Heterostelium album PN500]|uniref:Protein kinase domain-containing protein n=1 Tax=Heterostelium pallidum (strain ATCC 26659 / Pp 5 / PN500) TaxID=670386 RepID=D3B169_HETP5|nr:putative protein serine/threonine kinase [Heterostelium album PN500]EFA85043.1 putative protein serine/threonine kinase [Heterostelium album PN500]|eukprot:XP_020437153.1 putative protein serine/threonine kinase [Heterostelium album PN500]
MSMSMCKMKLLSKLLIKKKSKKNKTLINDDEELMDQKVVVRNKSSTPSKPRTNSTSPTPLHKKDSVSDVDDDVTAPSVICINNYKGLQKFDRKWVRQTHIDQELIDNNFQVVVHIINFLRKKDLVYYKYIEQGEQIAQIKDEIKEEIPSVIISTAGSGGGNGSGGNSPKPASSIYNSSNQSSDEEDDKSNMVGSHCSGSAISKPTHTDSLLRPNQPTNQPQQQHGAIVNTNTGSGPSLSFIYPERKKRIDSNRIFVAPGVFYKFPEEWEIAVATLLNEGDPKNQYKNLDFEARGGFGSVFAAKNKIPHCADDKQVVALKKMQHVTPKQIRMNLNEIGFMRFCQHPNIVKYLGAFQRGDELWMIMEFLEGGSLREATNNFNFCEARIAYIAREILKGIHFLHSNQLCHRDLKSSNIMISMKGEIKLIDFGLAIDFSHEKEDIHMCGSPFWMPPEQLHGNPHSLPADIWSFGVCIAEMINRKLPNSNSRLKAMIKVAIEGMVFTKEDHPDWSDEVLDFLRSCLQVDPSKRATTTQLMEHPFLAKACTPKEFNEILPPLFMSNTLARQGFIFNKIF